MATGTLLFGAGLPVLIVCLTTAIQRRTPDELQGRAFTAFELFSGVPQLLSILAGAVLVTLVDYRIPLVVMAVGIAAAGVYSALRLREDDPQPLVVSDLGDPAVVHLDVPVGTHLVEQPPVVADEQQRPVVRPERLLELLDRGQVEVVGRLVEHQAVGRAGPSAGRGRRGSAHPATACRRRGATWSAPRPNFASRVRASASSRPVAARKPSTSVRSAAKRAPDLVDLADDDAAAEPGPPGGQRQPAEQRGEQRRLAAPFGPTTASRSPQPTCEVDRSQPEPAALDHRAVQPGHLVPPAGRGAIASRSCQPSRGSSTSSSRSSCRSVAGRGRAAGCSRAGDLVRPDVLVGSSARDLALVARLRPAGPTPAAGGPARAGRCAVSS